MTTNKRRLYFYIFRRTVSIILDLVAIVTVVMFVFGWMTTQQFVVLAVLFIWGGVASIKRQIIGWRRV